GREADARLRPRLRRREGQRARADEERCRRPGAQRRHRPRALDPRRRAGDRRSARQERADAEDHRKISPRRHPPLRRRHLPPPHKDVDLTRADSLRKALEITGADAVVNAAAFAEVDRCETEPELAWSANADGVRWLAQLCRERNLALVQVSTDYVFDGKKGAP